MRKIMISVLLFAVSAALGDSAYIITVPAGDNGGPVVWLEGNADWEQMVCVYRSTVSGWVLVGTASSGNGTPSCIELPDNSPESRFLVWMLHRESPSDPGLPWLNSRVTVLKYGLNHMADPGAADFRKMTVVIGSEDGLDTDFDDGTVHFTWSSGEKGVFLDFSPFPLQDGFLVPPDTLAED